MNGPLWHCTGRRNDTLGCLGATEAEANLVRLSRYKAVAVRSDEDAVFVWRYLNGVRVKRRARHAGMYGALNYVTTVGARIAAQGMRHANVTIKVNMHPIIAGLEAIRDAFTFIDTERYRK